MPSRKKNKSNKNKKQTAAPPATSLAPDTTLGASPANIPCVKAAIASVVASHHLDVQAIIKQNVASIPAAAAPTPPQKPTATQATEAPPAPKKEEIPPAENKLPEVPVNAAIPAPAPAALVRNHDAADPRNQEQRPLPVPKADDRSQTKKAKSKKKCIIL